MTFRKATLSVWILLIALTTQVAFAAERDLFCSNEDQTDAPWSRTPATKTLSPQFAHLAHKAGDRLRLKGKLGTLNWSPAFYLPGQNPEMTLETAKAFCMELQTFCPSGRKMIGASRKHGAWNRILVKFKHNPFDHNETAKTLVCPNWDHRNGAIYSSVNQSYLGSADIPIPK